MPAKARLGRGLGALIPTRDDSTQQVDVDLIAPNPDQPRRQADSAALQELSQSILEHGILQPLLVTRVTNAAGTITYRLVAGERRLQAAKMAGLSRVPVVLRDTREAESLELALVENLQRADLSPLEQAAAFKRLIDEFGLTQDDVARRLGRGRVAVANTVRLLGLSPAVKASLSEGEITAGHARALLGAASEVEQAKALDAVRQRGLNVRQTEALVQALRAPESPAMKTPSPPPADPDREAIEDRLRAALATQVELRPARKGGRIVIRYYDNEDLEEILEVLLQGRAARSPRQ